MNKFKDFINEPCRITGKPTKHTALYGFIAIVTVIAIAIIAISI